MAGRRPAPPGRPGIFINYRHADALPHARLLQVNLRERFPDAPVFMDLDSIEAGLDFAKVISDAINECRVMVVLIGPRWATLTDDQGRRRLEQPDDFVRFEIRMALRRGIRVIPVLVEGAKPVRQQELPPDLRRLARLNALEMSCDHRYQYDADRLMVIIERALEE
jgi:TIR domain